MPRTPSVDAVLRAPAGALAVARFGHQLTADAVCAAIETIRPALREGAAAPDPAALADAALAVLIAHFELSHLLPPRHARLRRHGGEDHPNKKP